MAEVVFKIESILSQETESANSVVDDDGFIFKLRSLFVGKVADVNAPIGKDTDESFRTFTYAELVIATNGFQDKKHSPTINESIYKGWVDEKTYAPTKYGVGLAMYVRKMEIPTRKDIKPEDFNHPNIVKLMGYCLNYHELFCVYKLISGITLDKYLYQESRRTSLSWVARLKIAIGAAEGLVYLHKRKQPAYSRFKTHHILVDEDFNARLTDIAFDTHTFQLDAYYYAAVHDESDTFDGIRRRWLPEDGFAIKSEVYAFGVVLLEILTGMKVYDGRRPLEKQKLVEWAIPLLTDEVKLRMIMDPQFQHNDCPPKEAFKFAQLILNCLQPKHEKHTSMEYILKVLHHCYQNEIKTV